MLKTSFYPVKNIKIDKNQIKKGGMEVNLEFYQNLSSSKQQNCLKKKIRSIVCNFALISIKKETGLKYSTQI